MQSKVGSLRSNLPLLLIGIILAYIIGGAIFVFDEKALCGKSYILFMLCASLALTVVLIIIKAHNKTVHTLYDSFVGLFFGAPDKSEFYDFYNISHHEIIILIVIMLIGFILRILGFDWGHTICLHPDEGSLVNPAIVMADNKTLYSYFVYYPSQFTAKIVAIIIYVYSNITHVKVDRDTMIQAHHIFRIVVVIFGTATIYTAYLIGNRLRRHTGLIFAFFVAIYPHFNSYSKMVTGDVSTLFFLSITIIYSLRYIENPSVKYIILMAMTSAMATLDKWHGAIGIGYVGIVLILCTHDLKSFLKNGILAVFSYFIWLLIFAPNIMIDLKTTIMDGFINIAIYDGNKGYPYYIKLRDYILYGVRHMGGGIYIAAFFVGVGYMLANRSKNYRIFLLSICKMIIICFLNRHYLRWGMELYFVELLIISLGICYLLYTSNKLSRYISYIFAFIVSLSLLSGSLLVTVDACSTARDSRIVERHDCASIGITQENMLSQYYTGFNPAGKCDSEYPVNSYRVSDWSQYIFEKDGEIRRSSSCPDYICLNVSRYTSDEIMSESLGKYSECEKILEYRVVCTDTFETPFENLSTTYNDLTVISDNIKMIFNIINGGLIGDDIDIYYVGNVLRG